MACRECLFKCNYAWAEIAKIPLSRLKRIAKQKRRRQKLARRFTSLIREHANLVKQPSDYTRPSVQVEASGINIYCDPSAEMIIQRGHCNCTYALRKYERDIYVYVCEWVSGGTQSSPLCEFSSPWNRIRARLKANWVPRTRFISDADPSSELWIN